MSENGVVPIPKRRKRIKVEKPSSPDEEEKESPGEKVETGLKDESSIEEGTYNVKEENLSSSEDDGTYSIHHDQLPKEEEEPPVPAPRTKRLVSQETMIDRDLLDKKTGTDSVSSSPSTPKKPRRKKKKAGEMIASVLRSIKTQHIATALQESDDKEKDSGDV